MLQGLTQVEEMLISAVLPIMTLYRLPQGQYGYSGHVINLPQDVASFVNSLPQHPADLDVLRKEGSSQSHRDFRVRRSRVLGALRWLVANNTYYHNIHIDPEVLAQLPEDGNLSGLRTVNLETTPFGEQDPSHKDIDSYHANLPRLFVPQLPGG